MEFDYVVYHIVRHMTRQQLLWNLLNYRTCLLLIKQNNFTTMDVDKSIYYRFLSTQYKLCLYVLLSSNKVPLLYCVLESGLHIFNFRNANEVEIRKYSTFKFGIPTAQLSSSNWSNKVVWPIIFQIKQ